MTPTLRAPVLVPGVATGIGSLPHDDPTAAAELVLRCLPELPAVPQLPGRDPREGMIAQWLVALPEVEVAPDGSLTVLGESDAEPECVFDDRAHSGLLAFLDVASRARADAATGQGAGHRSADARCRVARRRDARARAFERAARRDARVVGCAGRARRRATARHRTGAVPRRAVVRGVASRRRAARSRGRDRRAVGRSLAAVDSVTGVHVCGDGDLALALEAGPEVLGVEVSDDLVQHTVGLGALPRRRRLDRVGRGADRSPGR